MENIQSLQTTNDIVEVFYPNIPKSVKVNICNLDRALHTPHGVRLDKCRTGYRLTLKGGHRNINLASWIMKNKRQMYDHVDGDIYNNIIENLREANHQENSCNKGLQSNNTSGFKGVIFRKRDGKYFAQIKVYTQKVYLGSFDTPKEAAEAYDRAALKYFGEFAKTNKMLGLL